jgi:hypothetical protein
VKICHHGTWRKLKKFRNHVLILCYVGKLDLYSIHYWIGIFEVCTLGSVLDFCEYIFDFMAV